MSEFVDLENTDAKSCVSTAICPWCGEAKIIVPHPSKPGREAAFCNCRGTMRSFIERPTKSKPRRKKQEGQAKDLPPKTQSDGQVTDLPQQESEL